MKNIFKKHNNNVLYELVRKNVKTQYRSSFLGMLWTVLNPLLNMLVMWLAFSQIFGRGDPLYPIYLLTGNILFSSLRAATSTSLTSIVNNKGILMRVKIEPYLFPLSSTLSSLVSFCFAFVALLVIMIFMEAFGHYGMFGYQMLFVLPMLPALLLFEYGLSLLLSAIFVYARDIKYLWSVFLSLWTYLTPIFYKVTMIKQGTAAFWAIHFNPMYHFVKYFRDAMYVCSSGGGGIPAWSTLGILYGVGVVMFGIGYLVFRLCKKNFMTNV